MTDLPDLPYHYRPELEITLETLEDLERLRDRLLDLGYTRAKVAGCIDFVLHPDDVELPVSSKTNYRAMLKELLHGVGAGPVGPGGRRRGASAIVAARSKAIPGWLKCPGHQRFPEPDLLQRAA